MASSIPSGSKRPRDPSVQGSRVKFLINIPLKVDSEKEAQDRCKYLLDALLGEGFKEEDKKFMKEKKSKGVQEVLEDIAVIFGMNGKHTPERAQVLKKLQDFTYDCKVHHSIITYTWGKDGDIAKDVAEDKVPYQDIREYLKNHTASEELVADFRKADPHCLVYFSFIDSDTVKFNHIYSEYLQIVREELKKDGIPPTVMSTGYELTHDSEHHIASWLDRTVRVAVAEVDPLLVYYPEPNFCVLVHEKFNTIEESFIKERRKKDEYIMESPVLIRQVMNRPCFKAVFADKKPVIIVTPERFELKDKGLRTGQSHLAGMNLATGALCHGVLQPKEKTIGSYYKNRGYIMRLFDCKNEEFEKLSKENPFITCDGKEATNLIEAVREARKYKKFIHEFDEKLQI